MAKSNGGKQGGLHLDLEAFWSQVVLALDIESCISSSEYNKHKHTPAWSFQIFRFSSFTCDD